MPHDLVKLARELHSVHGLMPVPVAGKVPLGGTGWNLLPFETRLKHIASPECTGLGIQCGFVFHPRLGPVDARGLDCDIDDTQKSMLFYGTLLKFFNVHQWRWGRRPAALVFTQPGLIKREKFGPVQLLGDGKQFVYWGQYLNKVPLPTDPPEYWHQGISIFDTSPPVVPANTLTAALEASVIAAGYTIVPDRKQDNALPLSTADLEMLTLEHVEQFKHEIESMLYDVSRSPTGSGRGTKLHQIGIKYGALIKASGAAPLLMDAMRRVSPDVVEFDTSKKHAFLDGIGKIAEKAFTLLPGTLSHGDQRDFARGVGASKGLSQSVAVSIQKHALPAPSGRGHPGQTVEDLMRENLGDLRFLVNRFLPDCGCIVLAGKPKIGKGWIVLELGLSVAEGGTFWNEPCEQGEVLMYMLEDGKRRVKERIRILRPGGFSATKNLRFRYSADGPFYVNSDGSGTLLDDIKAHLRCFPNIRMVVVDVLQRVRGTTERSDNAYQADYKLVGSIQKLAIEHNVLIIVVHHTKKGKVEDAIDSISGSFGVIGSIDGGIIIGKEGETVYVESRMRDINEFKFELTKEEGSPMWKPAVTAAEMFAPGEQTRAQTVLMALHAAACVLTAGDLARRTGLNEKNVGTYLGRLLKSGQVTKPYRGYYMALNLPYRERIKGVIDLIKRMPKTKATPEVKAQYAPNFDIPPEATYMILTDVAIKEIEACFVNGKDTLNSLKLRGLAVYNSDTVWLIGDDWEASQPVPTVNPYAMKYPWEQ